MGSAKHVADAEDLPAGSGKGRNRRLQIALLQKRRAILGFRRVRQQPRRQTRKQPGEGSSQGRQHEIEAKMRVDRQLVMRQRQ